MTYDNVRAQAAYEDEEPPQDDDGGIDEMDLLFYGVSALLVAIVFLAIFALPYTYTSSRVWYSQRDMAESNLFKMRTVAYRQKVANKVGVDYSTLFRDPDQEANVGLQRVGHRCLAGIEKRNKVMPHRLHKAHGDATDYLICAMTSELQRLCRPHNRERLAAQLIQFNDRRQNVYGAERARDELMNTRMARSVSRQFKRVANAIDGGGQVSQGYSKIDPQPDERITDLVRSLSEQGYLSASDFGYFGMILPADYVEHLVPAVSAPSC